MYKEFDFETYPQVIHFLWITVDKSVHTNNTALTGIKSDRTGAFYRCLFYQIFLSCDRRVTIKEYNNNRVKNYSIL